ncbi:transmembrane protein Tmp21-like [Amblyraja radiata]|uniref:transmembrane protein Tmp21-like n=1 Tax=Amblyraja radiata TaxID=386614 RepID=UPI001402BEB6|nr:transmembrane protein Tmp21-like [Amblyraja radiata]
MSPPSCPSPSPLLLPVALALAAITLLRLAHPAAAVSFHLPANARKCLREEIHKDVLVTGEYELSEQPGGRTDLKVTDSSGHILYSKEQASKGKFAFTTDDYDMFEICFENRLPAGHFRGPDQQIVLNTKHGVEAKNYEDVGHRTSFYARGGRSTGGGRELAGLGGGVFVGVQECVRAQSLRAAV